jgi:hypothetical protein
MMRAFQNQEEGTCAVPLRFAGLKSLRGYVKNTPHLVYDASNQKNI